MRRKKLLAAVASATIVISALSSAASAGPLSDESRTETTPPFGGPANVRYAQVLWQTLEERNLVGADTIVTYPYVGQEPHGAVLEFLEDTVVVDGHAGFALVKKNYRSDDLEGDAFVKAVLADREKYLASITVMFTREGYYDPEHDNWYWAKFNPDGTLQSNPKGMKLGGRVAKGAPKGCIACHGAAPGNDYIFTHDKWAK